MTSERGSPDALYGCYWLPVDVTTVYNGLLCLLLNLSLLCDKKYRWDILKSAIEKSDGHGTKSMEGEQSLIWLLVRGMIERSCIHLETPNFAASKFHWNSVESMSKFRPLRIMTLNLFLRSREHFISTNSREVCSIGRISSMNSTKLCGNGRGQWANKKYEDKSIAGLC